MFFATDNQVSKPNDNDSSRPQNELQVWIDSLGSALFCADLGDFTRMCESQTKVDKKVISRRTGPVTAFSPAHPVKMPDSASKLRVMKPIPANGAEVVVGDRTIVFPKSPSRQLSHQMQKAALEKKMMKTRLVEDEESQSHESPKTDPLHSVTYPHPSMGPGLVPIQGSPSVTPLKQDRRPSVAVLHGLTNSSQKPRAVPSADQKMENPRHLPGSYVFFDRPAVERATEGKENANNIEGFGNDFVNKPLQKRLSHLNLGGSFVSADVVEFGGAHRQTDDVDDEGKEQEDTIDGFGNDNVNIDLQKKIANIDLEDSFCFVSADIVEFGVAHRQMEVV